MTQSTLARSVASFSLGGYTSFLPDAWNHYLRDTIRSKHPGYFFRHLFARRKKRAVEANDCILVSLREYLLDQFGILLPRETLFSVYNEDGQGILPGKMIEAISSVIEPAGLEIDRIVVINPLLRGALGCPDKIVPEECLNDLHNRPGLCMINIDQGHSHAFYWKAMDARKFKSAQFRIAITLKCKDGIPSTFSPLNSLAAYSQMLKDYASGLTGGQEIHGLANELDQMLLLGRGGFEDCPEAQESFRKDLSQKLARIRRQLPSRTGPKKESAPIRQAGEMVERIIREVKVIA